MKRTFLSMLLVLPMLVMAQGWPAQYEGVMLQGFYWNSWNETSWQKLTEQSSELSDYFDIIWVPNSGTISSSVSNELTEKSSGYDPNYWFRHNSIWGTEAQLRTMIKTFKAKGVGIIEDVVINHKKGFSNWCDFVTEYWRNDTIRWSLADICCTDEAKNEGYNVCGNPDEGDNYEPFRDLDHTSPNVQKNVKLYLNFLLNDLGYTGFRYDLVKGYAGYYVGMYNDTTNPQFSVGEYWDSKDAIYNWLKETGRYAAGSNTDKDSFTPHSAAFDFGLKTVINTAFMNEFKPEALSDKSIAGWAGMNRWAVTFVENHDTYKDSDHILKNANHVLAANAFILTMPGTPCVFYPHWTAHKEAIKQMVLARKKAGITNESAITMQEVVNGGKGYRMRVQGKYGDILLLLGDTPNEDLRGFRSVWHGDQFNNDFAMFITLDCDLALPKGSRTIYFEAPYDWGKEVYCTAYKGNSKIATTDGGKMIKVTNAATGNAVYSWTYTGKNTPAPTTIVFSDNNGKSTAKLTYSSKGYYNTSGKAFSVKETTK